MATLTKSTGTVTLSGAVEKVTFPAVYGWVWVKNMSESDIFAGLSADISEGADGVMVIPAGDAGRIQTEGNGDVYLLGSGNVLVVAQNYADCPFKEGVKGGGADVGGESSYTLKNAVDYPVMGLNLYGKSTQDGTPTPDNPVEIVSVGDGGSVRVQSCGKNLLNPTVETITLNGVTCTNNGDGTYNVNGTTTAKTALTFCRTMLNTFKGMKLVGCPNNSDNVRLSCGYYLNDSNEWQAADIDRGNGVILNKDYPRVDLSIVVDSGVTVNNLVFKPMITTDLTATYDDFEPYHGATANITSAMPLCGIPVESGGNYTDSNGQQWVCDEVVYNADGTGKIIKRTIKLTFDGSDDEMWATDTSQSAATGIDNRHRFRTLALRDNVTLKPMKISSNDTLAKIICDVYPIETATRTFFNHNGVCFDVTHDMLIYDEGRAELSVAEWKSYLAANPVTVVYQLAEPQKIDLTAAEMSALRQLQTYNGITNISNDGGADMDVSYCTNKMLSKYVMPITTGLQSQIDELKAAVLSLGGNV